MPREDDGRLVEAEYSVIQDGALLALLLSSQSGATAGRTARNPDYIRGLTLLLTRLQSLGATLHDALVDSRNTRVLGLPEAERRLMNEPVHLVGQDISALRLHLTSAQGPIGQAPGSTKKGNNSKRIRLRLEVRASPRPKPAGLKLRWLRPSTHMGTPTAPRRNR
ncbi:hypothetical protein AB0C10_05385 [Microbispora amethystogenes]|uniref:hypothetical protein n=1 Tax=Microbispora amethystogenes TaxID=1427754 RepID=UPI0033D65739